MPGRRFAFVCPKFHPRTCGVGDFSARLAQELRRRDFDVTIHARAPVEPHPEAPQIPVVGYPDAGPMAIARSVFRAVVEAGPTDVIVQYTPQMWGAWRFGSPAVPWLVGRLRKAGLRVFVIAHELYFPLGFRPDLVVASVMLRAQLAALLWGANRVMVTTETRLRHILPFCRALGLPLPGVVRVGANAMPQVRSAGPRGARLGIFSSAAVGKRFDVLLDAFKWIALERPDAELVLIGDLGPEQSPRVRALVRAVRRHPASGRIRITGRLDLGAVTREIQALDVYLFAMDTGANTRSSTLPSALGSGIPVVAVKGSETDPSVFRNRENVLYASELSGPALAAASMEILRDPALALRLSGGARALYERDLTWPRIVDQLLAHLGAD